MTPMLADHDLGAMTVPSKMIDRDSPQKKTDSKILKMTLNNRGESSTKIVKIRRSSQSSRFSIKETP